MGDAGRLGLGILSIFAIIHARTHAYMRVCAHILLCCGAIMLRYVADRVGAAVAAMRPGKIAGSGAARFLSKKSARK